MNIIVNLRSIFFLMAFFASVNLVGQNTIYYAFIPNAAGDIDKDGFDIGYHSIFSQWDLNGDGDISDNEFYTVIFKRLDSNKNGDLSAKEWQSGQKYLFGQSFVINNESGKQERSGSLDTVNPGSGENLEFKSFDLNNDNKITPGEFDSGLRNTDFFKSYDSNENGRLDRSELNKGVYQSMDLDGDGIIDKMEFQKVSKFYIN